MTTLKLVLVKISIFMLIFMALTMKQYLNDCVSAGTAYAMFQNPHILTAFYTSMTDALECRDSGNGVVCI